MIRDLSKCSPSGGTVATVGVYDGVHRGHLSIFDAVRAAADERGLASAVVTFDRHPAVVLRPDTTPSLLTDLDQKLELIEACGIDYTVLLTFDEGFSKREPAEFVREVLVGGLAAQVVVVGSDFHFGHDRAGNVSSLVDLAEQNGFDVIPASLVARDGDDKISSSTIRELIGSGEVEDAAQLLGRSYEVRGAVDHGDERGRTIGFPTANVTVPNVMAMPADGVYACWYIHPDGSRNMAAVNLGRRPTFYEDAPVSLLEAHLLDFSGDLYGQSARVQFVARLRGEVRFDGVEGLVAQLASDVDATRDRLGRAVRRQV